MPSVVKKEQGSMENQNINILSAIEQVVKSRMENMPEGSYVTSLMKSAPDGILRKVSEEACELVLAAKNEDKRNIVHEAADLIFHILVLLNYYDLSINDICMELQKRFKPVEGKE